MERVFEVDFEPKMTSTLLRFFDGMVAKSLTNEHGFCIKYFLSVQKVSARSGRSLQNLQNSWRQCFKYRGP